MNPPTPPTPPDLGKPLAEYHMNWRIFWAFQLILLAVGVGAAWLAVRDPDPRLFMLALIGLLLPLLTVATSLPLSRGRRATIYEQGLRHSHRGQEISFSWGEVAWLRLAPSAWVRSALRVGLADGRELRLAAAFDPPTGGQRPDGVALANMGELIQGLQVLAMPVMLKRAVAAYKSGAELDFGPLRLSQAGLRAGDELLPWAEVEDLDLAENRFIVTRSGRRGAWRSFGPKEILNAALLPALIAEIHGEVFSLSRPGQRSRGAQEQATRNNARGCLLFSLLAGLMLLPIVGWFAYDFYTWSTDADRHIRSGYSCLSRCGPDSADDALASFERALEIRPGDPRALCGRGSALARVGRPAEARADLEACRAAATDPALVRLADDELARLATP